MVYLLPKVALGAFGGSGVSELDAFKCTGEATRGATGAEETNAGVENIFAITGFFESGRVAELLETAHNNCQTQSST